MIQNKLGPFAMILVAVGTMFNIAGCDVEANDNEEPLGRVDQALITKLTDAQSRAQFTSNGIGIVSTGNCSDRFNRACTSLEQINASTSNAVVGFKTVTGCSITVTGGTECGHEVGAESCLGFHDPALKSHWNGYKVDYRKTTCIDAFITNRNNMTPVGLRGGDNAPLYLSAGGNIYADEGTHWDVTYNQQ